VIHLFVLSFMFAATAATGPASLSCKVAGSRAGGLTLRGLVPATQATLELTLTDGTASLALNAERGDQGHVVEAFADKVFTLVVTRKEAGDLVLYGLPRSIKARREPFAVHAAFDAVLVSSPGPGGGASITNAKLRCLYDYEV
jgi:hypothetical protein